MQENIDFGIDLGTTNSAIGHYVNGKVNVLKNPKGFKEILPSAVAFRKGRILVGDKAMEQLASNPQNVFTTFKRDMGTESVYVAEESSVTPMDLSTYILRELLGFVQDHKVSSAVITIPASFDIMQSNATKKAGLAAGLNEVVLLQEPIAACLAYANENNLDLEAKQTWLVYDFGGGTFDSALVEIDHKELKVKDHLGNNFLGGVDIDNAILGSSIIPVLLSKAGIDLNSPETSKEADFLMFRQYLLYLIEEAKKELSVSESSVLEIDFPALDIYMEIILTREEFNVIVSKVFEESVSLLKKLIHNNNLSFHHIGRIILVGGTTYIPAIREGLKELTGIPVDSSIDPTTAIVKGAVYFAGTKQRSKNNEKLDSKTDDEKLAVSLFFENTTNDEEELISIKSAKDFKGYYSIAGINGNFDTGLREFKNEASEFVPVLPKQANRFRIIVYDKRERIVYENEIAISQGLYSITGQTMPLDICLEVDSEDGTSYLEPIFKKNSVLPLKKTLYKTLSKSVSAGSSDSIFINVLEGKRGTMPASNLTIGFITINGKDISSDLIRGTDIELNFSISESRDLEIEVYIPSSDLTLKKNFNPHIKMVVPEKLKMETNHAIIAALQEIQIATNHEHYELASRFQAIAEQLQILKAEIKDEQAGTLYKLDEKKRTLLKELDGINRSKHIFEEIEAYKKAKGELLDLLANATSEQSGQADKILSEEKEIVNSGDKQLIRHTTEKITTLNNILFYQRDENFIRVYLSLKSQNPDQYKNYQKVQQIIIDGDRALHNKDYPLLKNICFLMISELRDENKAGKNSLFISVTGLK